MNLFIKSFKDFKTQEKKSHFDNYLANYFSQTLRFPFLANG
jgi:hypothetical protein